VRALACLLLVACGTSGPEPQASGSGGAGAGGAPSAAVDAGPDAASEPLEVVPLALVLTDQPTQVVNEGDTLTLRFPPQGGFVLWTTAKARDLTTAHAEIRSRLRRLKTNVIVSEESRTPDMGPVPGEPGWFEAAPLTLRNVNHIPMCPTYENEPILGEAFVLEVTVSELDDQNQHTGRSGTATRTVTVACAEGALSCECECSVGYVLGGCGADGGAPGG
jgi:hypothetical protein